jgi:hypothetical protein
MFRHQGAIIREFFSNKVSYVQQVLQALFAHSSVITVVDVFSHISPIHRFPDGVA